MIVDETSMVSLSLMARLVEAVRPDARLVLVGDPAADSIEAGAVLGDIVGAGGPRAIVVLDRVHRYGGGIAALADGDPRAATATRPCARARDGVHVDRRSTRRRGAALAPVRERRGRAPRAVIARRARGRRARRRSRRSARSASCARTAAAPYGVSALDGADRGLAAGDDRPRPTGTPAARCS